MIAPLRRLDPLAPDANAAQRAASDPTTSVWVNASAGSGKTKVLTERVMRLLLSGTAPEKILCLTYTRAGAAEMANRIRAKLSHWAVCDDHALDHDLYELQDHEASSAQRIAARQLFARVISCPGGLRIRTIHSFCQEILSRFPLEAGLPPHFSLIDESDLDTLRHEVLDDLLREAADYPDQKLAQALSVLVSAQGEYKFLDMLQEIMRAGEVQSDGIRPFLQVEPDDNAEKFRRELMQKLPVEQLRRMAGWLAEGKKTDVERSKNLTAVLAASNRASLFDTYRNVFLTQKNTPREKIATKDIAEKYPDIQSIADHETTLLLLTLERIEAAEIAELTESALFFGRVFAARLQARKASRAALDYDDLIQKTEALLNRPGLSSWILYKLDHGIDHILVDEAQDTSRAQWAIVQALTAEFHAGQGAVANHKRTLFVVGDEKQSIFSFQNADPAAFLAYRDFFAQRMQDSGKNFEKIGLHTSFRSAPEILNAVDAIFASDIARSGVSDAPVHHISTPNKDGTSKMGRVEIWPLLTALPAADESDGSWMIATAYEDEHDPQAELAEQIALKIKGWLTRHEALPGSHRPIAPGDIMILLRRRGRFANLMVRALKTHKIAVTGVDRMRLISQLPVMDLLALLRFVLLPEDDLNLAALLRSPLLGVSEDQLMELAIGRSGTLWQAARTSDALTDARDYLTARLDEADFTTPFAFLSHILNAPCPANVISGRKALWARLGDESLDPIDELLNEAQHFSNRHSPSLQNFLHWLTQSDTEIKRELDRGNAQEGGTQDGGQVRIMTVHASKGLEAPIVFLPDTTAVPRAADLPRLQWSADGVPLFLKNQPSFGAAAQIWQVAREKQMQEYRRLFYVALTRAANRLYLCGYGSGKEKEAPEESWYGLATAALADSVRAPDDVMIIKKNTPLSSQEPLPAWAQQPVKVMRKGQMRSATEPTVATPNAAFARGIIIHRLLQSLPALDSDKRPGAMQRFLEHPRHKLSPDEQKEIAAEVGAIITHNDFAALFAPDSIAEAPLSGTIDGIAVFRQVDRLCLRGDEVWIVDYKTNRPPPLEAKDIPVSYREQLSEYRGLLRGIYPQKKIRTFLLWTYKPLLMEVREG